MKNYESLIDALADLRKRGYVEYFESESSSIYCGALDIRLYPEAFIVEQVHRFEEDSNPGDNAVLYAISSSEGIKGTVVDGYGAYAENISFEMARKLQLEYTS